MPHSRDLLTQPVASAVAWWLPQAGIAAALLAPVSARAAIWTAVLIWTGAACLLNARRCGRTHCRYTGPFYLVMILPVLAAAWAGAPMPVWLILAAVILFGGKAIWWATEQMRGKYDEAAS